MSYGIQETKDCLTVLDTAAKMVIKMVEEKKFSLDLTSILTLVQKAPVAIQGISQVPAEIKNLDAAEVAELTTFIVTDLAFDAGKASNILSTGLAFVSSGYQFVLAIKG